jgi:hypothetical protein
MNTFGAKPAFLLSELIPKFKPPVAMVGSVFFIAVTVPQACYNKVNVKILLITGIECQEGV